MLRELRVLETGARVPTGFLLTVAFQQGFAQLSGFQMGLHLVLTPVALHRRLFRQRREHQLVPWADRLRPRLAAPRSRRDRPPGRVQLAGRSARIAP